MSLDQRPYTLDRIVRIGISVSLIGGLVWLLGYLSDVLIPFAVAFLLAYLINPLVNCVQKKIAHRGAAVLVSLCVIAGVVVIVFALLCPLIVNETVHMTRIISDVVNNSDLAERAARRLPPNLWEVIKNYAASEQVQQFFQTDNFWIVLEAVVRKILPGVWGIISGTASFLMSLIALTIVGLYLVFLLIDYDKVRERWKHLLPVGYREPVISFIQEFNGGMNRYFRAQALVASIVGALFALGFSMIGLPMGILLGLFIGLLNMVPYLQILGLLPAGLLSLVHALETGGSFWLILSLTALVFIVVQLIQDTLLVPRIMGKVTGLSPAMILLSLSVWGKLLGILGLIIALPVTCILLAYYRRFLAKRA